MKTFQMFLFTPYINIQLNINFIPKITNTKIKQEKNCRVAATVY